MCTSIAITTRTKVNIQDLLMLFGLFPILLGGKTEISMHGFMCFCLNPECGWPPFVGGPRPRPTRPRPKEGPRWLGGYVRSE